MKEEKQTLLEMICGIMISSLILGAIGAIVFRPISNFVLGVVFGTVIAVFVLVQLYHSLNKTLDMDSQSAEKIGGRHAIFRLFIMGLALVVGILLSDIFNVIGILLGIFGLKFSAYLQPAIHKIVVTKILNKGR